eukprot:CAMPEP_0194227932 /NCGR_PEP_ID=MMETSP0156-20130528/43112_1 /TAXON_ID=33649 /ORGANISM="Thalassionema nitzschioides, Strain L26-B" /LENGTH=154 /DNA_ID=CAMNT_0038960429 /DNA_START=28 /DNA_END=492 /DNA_ORIENTATION=+
MPSPSFNWADSSSELDDDSDEEIPQPPPPKVTKPKSGVSSLQGLSTGQFSPTRKPIQGLVGDFEKDKLNFSKKNSPKREGHCKQNNKGGKKNGRGSKQTPKSKTNNTDAEKKGTKQTKKSPSVPTNSKRSQNKSPKQSKPKQTPTSLMTRLEIT